MLYNEEQLGRLVDEEVKEIALDPEYWFDREINIAESMTHEELFDFARKDKEVYEEVQRDLKTDLTMVLNEVYPDKDLLLELRGMLGVVNNILREWGGKNV